MSFHQKMFLPSAVALSVFFAGSSVFSTAYSQERKAAAEKQTIEQVFQYSIPQVSAQQVTALEVTYPPGGFTAPHLHGKNFVVAYVMEGEIRSQLDDGKVQIYKAGQSWSEQPGTHHRISANNSATKPARLLAIFIGPKNDSHLVVFEKNPPKE
ncbi:cupin domain-containing protein [Entomobacter blattae]|uniref:Cupin domain protein n=1 Tax=Entomobacter blattae TaxID=2762277 RepID=A0A7H1NTX2_9PROT|nr:cupin domain-containing protein [Entomobacter blattae]QNT79232.1 Cupin domain protein [Entomobacter blattae]